MPRMAERPPAASAWDLDPEIDFLNHGSFGACPRVVLAAQQRLRSRLEREPVTFLVREIEGRMAAARAALGAFVGADPDDLAFVSNATTGVNTVLRSLRFAPGDEILTTDHAYSACANALRFVARRDDARAVIVTLPFPIAGPDTVRDAVLAAAGPRTRLALLDHITSPTGMVLPIAEMVAALSARGIDTLVDGAHGPGMVPLDLNRLGAAYYTGNGHKWMCAPKGAAFLHVRRDRQETIRPLTISHGANSPRRDVSRFRLEFDWMGTDDPTPWLCLPAVLEFMPTLLAGGWEARMAANRTLALGARQELCAALDVPPPCPDSMMGSLAAVPLPDSPAGTTASPLGTDLLTDVLYEQHRIEVPVLQWPAVPRRLLRVSAQAYNHLDQFRRLAALLPGLVGRG